MQASDNHESNFEGTFREDYDLPLDPADQQTDDNTDHDQNSVSQIEKDSEEDEYKSIEECFNTFNDSFQAALAESFQLFADCALKLAEVHHNIYQITEEVAVEHQHLMNKKRGALDFVDSFK